MKTLSDLKDSVKYYFKDFIEADGVKTDLVFAMWVFVGILVLTSVVFMA